MMVLINEPLERERDDSQDPIPQEDALKGDRIARLVCQPQTVWWKLCSVPPALTLLCQDLVSLLLFLKALFSLKLRLSREDI